MRKHVIKAPDRTESDASESRTTDDVGLWIQLYNFQGIGLWHLLNLVVSLVAGASILVWFRMVQRIGSAPVAKTETFLFWFFVLLLAILPAASFLPRHRGKLAWFFAGEVVAAFLASFVVAQSFMRVVEGMGATR